MPPPTQALFLKEAVLCIYGYPPTSESIIYFKQHIYTVFWFISFKEKLLSVVLQNYKFWLSLNSLSTLIGLFIF